MHSLFDKIKVDWENSGVSRNKLIGIGSFGIALAGVFGYLLNNYLYQGSIGILWVAITLTAFGTLFLLQTLFINSRYLLLAILILEVAAMSAIFLGKVSFLMLTAGVLAAIFLWRAVRHGKNEMENQLKISFFRAEKWIVPKALTALAIFISLLYVNSVGFENGVIPKKSLNSFFRPTESIVRSLIDDFSFDMTAGEFGVAIVKLQLGSEKISTLSPATVSATANQLLDTYRQSGLVFKNSDSLLDVIYSNLSGAIQKAPKGAQVLIPIVFGLLAFAVIRGFAILLRWVISGLGYLFYRLALWSGFAALATEIRNKEIIILK